METRPNRSNGYSQHLGDLVMTQLLPDDQHEQLPISGLQRGDRRQHGSGVGTGVDPLGHPVDRVAALVTAVVTMRHGPGHRPQSALLGAPMAPDQIGGDSEQPRARRAPLGVEAVLLIDGDPECLGRDVGSEFAADTAGDICVDGVDMLLIEDSRITHRRIGLCRIDGIAHIRYLPAEDEAFTENAGPTGAGSVRWFRDPSAW